MGLILLVLIVVVSIWRRTVVARAATDVATAMRRQIHRQMYRLGQSSLPTEGVGPVINLWTREVNDVRDGLFADLDNTPRLQILAGGLLVVALLVSPILTVFLASVGLLVWLTARKMETDARLASDAALRDASVQLVLLHEDLGLLRTVRVYSVEEYDRERFDEHLERFQKADYRRMVTAGRMSPSTVLLFGAAIALALGLLGYNVLITKQIAIGTMLILFVALTGLAYPITEWIRLRRAIRQANRSAGGIFEFLERKPELHQDVRAQFLEPPQEQIALEHVTLESRSGRVLLDDVSVEIPARARTALLGLQEDSKLALACLIPRLIDPKSGRVRVDGRDLREATLESVRAQVATVLQADLVFTDSVLVNIGLGDPINTLPRVIEAAKLTHAHHFIQDLPHGYDTVIGPLGHYLKPDEQFRIALARAYLHDPSILIVEEPKEPLDGNTQHFIDDTLTRLSIGRTVIVIPHRLSSVRASDHVIVLNEGPRRGCRVAGSSAGGEQALSAPDLHRVQRVCDRRDRGRRMNHAEAPQDAAGEVGRASRRLGLRSAPRRTESLEIRPTQQKSSTVGLMTSSGTWARGWSSTRNRTAAATSSGWRITARRSAPTGTGRASRIGVSTSPG